jgi:hypothetical protein
MIYKCESNREYITRIYAHETSWHKYFTYFPKFIEGAGLVWLQEVERKGELIYGYDLDYFIYEYRMLT